MALQPDSCSCTTIHNDNSCSSGMSVYSRDEIISLICDRILRVTENAQNLRMPGLCKGPIPKMQYMLLELILDLTVLSITGVLPIHQVI